MKFELLVERTIPKTPSTEHDIRNFTVRDDYIVEAIDENKILVISDRYDVIARIGLKLKELTIERGEEKIHPYKVNARIREHRFLMYVVAHLFSLAIMIVAHNLIELKLPVSESTLYTLTIIVSIFASMAPWIVVLYFNMSRSRLAGIVVIKLLNDEYRLIKSKKMKTRWNIIGPSGHMKLDFTVWENKVLIHKNNLFNSITDPYNIVRQLLARKMVDVFETT